MELTHRSSLSKSVLECIKVGEFDVSEALRLLISVLDDFHRLGLVHNVRGNGKLEGLQNVRRRQRTPQAQSR